MSKLIVILILALILLGGVIYYKQTDLDWFSQETDWYACKIDAECIRVPADACGCANMGKATAINKKWEKEYLDVTVDVTAGCPEALSQDPTCFASQTIPKCVVQRCELAPVDK